MSYLDITVVSYHAILFRDDKMTLTQKAYDCLRRDIVSGDLIPGQPLRLDALKRRYGMGFSPLREALTRLEGERLVVAAALRGFSVSPLSLAEMWDIIETRILIESDALSRSIRIATDRWESDIVGRLHALTLQARRLSANGNAEVSDLETLEVRHQAFHRALIAGCGSSWLLDFAEKLYVSAERYRYPALVGSICRGGRDVSGEHTALAQAAIDRNEARACDLLKRHYRKTGEEVEARFATLVSDNDISEDDMCASESRRGRSARHG